MPKHTRQKKPAPSSANPLDALLREKRAAEKRGTSSTSLYLAENTVRQLEEGQDDKLYHLSLMDEQAAWRAVRSFQPSTPPRRGEQVADAEGYDFGLGQTRILGSEAGAAIAKILADDRNEKFKNEARIARREKAPSVPLWTVGTSDDMEVELGSPSTNTSFGHGSAILDLINELHATGDDAQLALLLKSGAVIDLPPEQLTTFVSSLFVIGLFSSAPVADAAFYALRDMCTSGSSKVVLPFSVICTALVQLGARSCVFEQVGWQVEGCPQNMYLSSDTHSEVLLRLVAAIKLTALSGALANDEVADHILGLVLIGLDTATCHVLRAELNATIDAICTNNAADLAARVSIHKKVLDFASKLNPVNKARLLTFFSSGGAQTRHIAQWLAHSLLIFNSVPLTDELPPLDPLILLLSPPPDSGQLFDVTCEDTDYDDLGHYVSILAVALTNIVPYIKDVLSVSKRGNRSGKAKNINPPLKQVRLALDAIHGKIIDTRAAHLDRSRVKAALQRLTMRLFFEHSAIEPRGRTSVLPFVRNSA